MEFTASYTKEISNHRGGKLLEIVNEKWADYYFESWKRFLKDNDNKTPTEQQYKNWVEMICGPRN